MKGLYLQNTHISAAYSPYVANKVPTYCYYTALNLNGNICQLSHLHIHENLYKHKNKEKNRRKMNGVYLQNYQYLSC